MKRLISIAGFLLLINLGFAQTVHSVTVAINQGDGCPIVDAIDSSELFSVFPNPATSSITIKSKVQTGEIRLVDFHGKEVRTQKVKEGRLTMDIEDLAKGIYVLFLNHENGIEKIKIKIQ